MYQYNTDLVVLQETKLTDEVYTRRSSGYSVIATDAPRRHCGGVAVFYRASMQFSVKLLQQCGTNVVSFHMSMGGRQWYIVGLYLAPDATLTIYCIVVDVGDCPKYWWQDISTPTSRDQKDWSGVRRSQRPWKQRYWMIFQSTLFCTKAPGTAAGEHGAWSIWGGRRGSRRVFLHGRRPDSIHRSRVDEGVVWHSRLVV